MIRLLGNALLFAFVIVGGMVAWSSFNSEDATTNEISIDASAVPSRDRPVVEQAAAILLNRCNLLIAHRNDIDSITASTVNTTSGAGDGQYHGHPWPKVIELKVVISRNPSTLPRWTRAAGHHLHYALGGGSKPGIDMMKEQSNAMCSDSPRESAFIADERLSLVDQLHG